MNLPHFALLFGKTERDGSYTLGCGAAMKVSVDGHLEGARSLSRVSRGIFFISQYFLGTLTERGPIFFLLFKDGI